MTDEQVQIKEQDVNDTPLRRWRLSQVPPVSQKQVAKEFRIALNTWRAYEYGDLKTPKRLAVMMDLWQRVKDLEATRGDTQQGSTPTGEMPVIPLKASRELIRQFMCVQLMLPGEDHYFIFTWAFWSNIDARAEFEKIISEWPLNWRLCEMFKTSWEANDWLSQHRPTP